MVDRVQFGPARGHANNLRVDGQIVKRFQASIPRVFGISASRDSKVRGAIAVLVYEDIPAAHDYLVRVVGFGAGRVDRDDEGEPVHGEVQAGECVIYLHRVAPEYGVASRASLGADTAGVDVTVENVDSHHAHAKAQGATIVYPPADMPYGFREYGARDLEGWLWSFMAAPGNG